jgi:N-acetylneuraminate lyase
LKSKLSGLIAAPYTPFHSSGELALDVIAREAALLARNGVSGAFICGTTGEGQSQTLDERKRVAEAWRQAAPSTLKVVVQVGCLSLGDSRELAEHAQAIGVDAIATIAPSFLKPAGASELVAWCREIAAAAPKLPFYYYHMPAMTGVPIAATEFLRVAHGVIPTLAGVKFTHEDLMDYCRAGRIGGGRYAMLFGRDEILLAGLGFGAAGAVGSTYNFAAPLFLRIMECFNAGDMDGAQAGQARAQEMIAVLHKYRGLAAGKAAMKLVGVDCGPTRLPLRTLSDAETAGLRADLEAVGFFDYCCKPPQ